MRATLHRGRPMSAAIVEDNVDGQRARMRPIDLLQEADELFGPMPLLELGQDLPSSDVEGRVQADRAVPLVVVRAPLDLPGLEWQHRLGAVECLDLGFLVHRQHESAITDSRPPSRSLVAAATGLSVLSDVGFCTEVLFSGRFRVTVHFNGSEWESCRGGAG